MIELEKHTVVEQENPIRFIDYVVGVFEAFPTRNSVKKGIKKSRFLLNGVEASTGAWVKKGDLIQLIDLEEKSPKAFERDVPVLYEDDHLAIVNKPPGLITSGNHFRTLENALIEKLNPSSERDALKWGRVAHRLDKMTSGLVIVAKAKSVLRSLKKQFEAQLISKEYTAVLAGELNKQMDISEPIDGLHASSIFMPVRQVDSLNHGKMTLAKLQPSTGRKHQLRKHATHIGAPIAGDTIYGEKGNVLLHKGLYLCATSVQFDHPVTQKLLCIEIDYPQKFDRLLDREEARWVKYRTT